MNKTNKKRMIILYLHGLESKLNVEKRAVLEQFGTVIAPDMDYHNNPDIFDLLLKNIEEMEIDVVMGSSMGGFMGYYIANTIKKPALLFNPALPFRSVEQNIPDNPLNTSPFLHFALGGQDNIVIANDNLKWIAENRNSFVDVKISIHSQMGHQIPLAIFDVEVTSFIQQLDH